MVKEGELERNRVLTVGEGGRGFVLSVGEDRYVVTAAYCLPRLPSPFHLGDAEEATYERLLAPLGEKPHVWGECLYADPVADVAVLGAPSHPDLMEHMKAFRALVEGAGAFPLGQIAEEGMEVDGFMLSLDNRWTVCTLERWGNIVVQTERTVGGMPGSPIVNADGEAISLVSTGHEGSDDDTPSGQRALAEVLPHWLVMRAMERRA